jgi:hypothetical protein
MAAGVLADIFRVFVVIGAITAALAWDIIALVLDRIFMTVFIRIMAGLEVLIPITVIRLP